MLRKSMVVLLAIAATALLTADAASARGGYRGGGYRVAVVRTGTFANNAWRTGFYPGYRPFRRFPVAAAAVVGAGFTYGAYPYGYYNNGYYNAAAYGYYPPYDDEGNYAYNAGGYYGDGGCTIIQRRIPTPYGWVLRPVQVCP